MLLNPNKVTSLIKNNLTAIIIFLISAIIYWSPWFIGRTSVAADLSTQYYPWFNVLHKTIRGFTLPFWVSEMGSGYPLYAQGEVGVFYPINWLLIWLFSPEVGFKIYFLIHSFLATLNLYLYAREIKISKWGAIISGLVFAYSFFFTSRFIHPSIIATAAYLPLGLFIFEKALNKQKIKLIWFISIIIGLQFIAGHPQIALISILTYLIYGLIRIICLGNLLNNKFKAIVFLLGSLILGCFLASIQIIPTMLLTSISTRLNVSTDFIFAYSLPKSHYLTYIFPFLFGLTPAGDILGFTQFGGLYWEFALYIGIFPIILAILGVSDFRKIPLIKTVSFTLIFFIILAVGGYLKPYRFIVNIFHLPFRVSARFILAQSCMLSVLAGLGWDKIQTVKLKFIKWISFVLGIFTIGASIISFYPQIAIFKQLNTNISKILHNLIFTEGQQIQFIDFSILNYQIWVPLIFWIASIMAIFMFRKKWLSKTAWIALSLGLIISDTFLQGLLFRQQTDSPAEIYNAVIPDIDKNSRVFSQRIFVPEALRYKVLKANINLLENISSFNATTPLQLNNQEKIDEWLDQNPQYLGDFNIRYFFTQNKISNQNLNIISTTSNGYLYESIKIRPKIYFSNSLHKDNPEIKVDIIKDADFSTYQKIRINTQQQGWLIVQDNYYPEWTAKSNGNIVPVVLANSIYKAVRVEKGQSGVEFIYQPWSFYIGISITILSLFVLLLVYRKL